MADNTILKGYWCFDKTIDVGTGIDFSINYTCTINSTKYNGNRIFTNAALGMLYQYDDNGSNNMTLVYAPDTYPNAWNDDDSQTIFVNDEIEQTAGLLAWLQTNATKVEFDYNLEEQSVNEYLYVISNLQSKMQNLIISQGGTVKYKSLEQYMQSLIDLRKRFVEILASFNIEASESEKMSPAWADKFNQVVANLVKGYDLTDLEIVDDKTTSIAGSYNDFSLYLGAAGYGVPRIKKLTLNKLERIGPSAFKNAVIDELIINSGDFWWENYSGGYRCALVDVKTKVVRIPNYNKTTTNATRNNVVGLFLNNYYVEEIYMDNIKYVPYRFCEGCTSLKKVYLPKATSQHSSCFSNCKNLVEVYLPLLSSYVTNQGSMFANCTSLETISLPRVTYIWHSMFKECTSLKNVEFSSELYFINYNAFYGCTSLVNVDFLETVKTINYAAFQNCTSLINVNAPLCDSIGSYTFNECTSLETVTLGIVTSYKGQTSASANGNYMFNGCKSLKTINATFEVEKTGINMFDGCTSLETAPTLKVSIIREYAFRNCKSLKTIGSDEATQIESYVFQNCTSLEEVNFPNVTTVGAYAFNKCTSLVNIELKNLTSNTTGWLEGCTSLQTAHIGLSPNIFLRSFYGCTSLTDIYLGYHGLVTLSNTNAFSSATTTNPVTVHVRSDYADSYATATNWSSLISAGKIIIVGDYSD